MSTLESFKQHLERTESPRTVTAYLADASEFERFRAGRPVSIDTLEAWVATVNHGRKPQTVGRKLAGVRRWLAFLGRHGDMEATAALAILTGGYQITRGPRQIDRRQIQPVTAEEYLAARDCAPVWGRHLMDLLWWTGCRISEAIGDPVAGIPHLTIRDGLALTRDGYVQTAGGNYPLDGGEE